MDERTQKTRRSRTRAEKVEHRLRRFASLRLDPAEVRASREFHLLHWLRIAEISVRQDHRELFYRGLSPSVEGVVADYPEDDLPTELQAAVLRDLAFLEGHLQAYRDVLRLLRALR